MTTPMRVRPGRNLLVALEILDKDFADFAVEAKMSPTGDRQDCRVVLRKYTHKTESSTRPSPAWAGPDMVESWGEILRIDPQFFYLKTPNRRDLQKAQRVFLGIEPTPAQPRPFIGLAWRNPKVSYAERVRLYFKAHPMEKVTAVVLAEEIKAERTVVSQALHRGARAKTLQKDAGSYWYDPALASGTDSATAG